MGCWEGKQRKHDVIWKKIGKFTIMKSHLHIGLGFVFIGLSVLLYFA